MFSQIIGNLMAAFVIQHVEESTFYFILTCICLMAPFMFCFLGSPVPIEISNKQALLAIQSQSIAASIAVEPIADKS